MKRLVSIMCVVAMLFSFATSVAASDFDFLSTQYKSCDANMEFYFESASDLDFLSGLNEEFDNQIDLKYLVNDLLKAKFNADLKMQVSDDYLSGKMYMGIRANTPINFSQDLKISVDSAFKMWVEYDVTSVENFKMKLIFNNPLNGKYMIVDMNDEVFKQSEEYTEAVSAIVDGVKEVDFKTGAEGAYALAKALYEENATLTKTEDGYLLVTFTNNSLVELYFDLFEDVLNDESLKTMLEMNGASVENIGDEQIAMIKATVKAMGIFADEDAFTMKVKLDEKGQIKEGEEKLHVQFNAYELAEMMGVSEEDAYPFTKENSDIDLTFVSKAVYNSVNENVVIDMPAVNDENSVNVLREMYEEYNYTDDDETYDYQPEYFSESCYAGYVDGVLYLSVEDFNDSADYDKDNYMCEVLVGEDGRVQLVMATDYMAPVVIGGYIGADSYTINGVELSGKAFENVDITVYGGSKTVLGVLPEVLSKVLQSEVRYMSIEYMSYSGTKYDIPKCSASMRRPNRGYKAEVETEAAE